MKTSNKLLIAFAAALILIPILCIAYVSRVYYEKGDYIIGNMDAFGPIPKKMSSIDLQGSFESVNLKGGGKMHLIILLVKDEKYGVKIPDDVKDLITAQIDSAGQLQIVLKETDPQQDNYARIYIHAPNITALKVSESKGITLSANMDSLDLKLTNTNYAYFNQEARIGQLRIHTANVEKVSFRETNVKSAYLDLTNTNVKSEMSSFENLSILSAGTSEIVLDGGEGNQPEKVIKKLTLNTLGKSEVKVLKMLINECSGSFSDSTRVEMPAINLNQMYKVKK